jgi:hypothetical protein
MWAAGSLPGRWVLIEAQPGGKPNSLLNCKTKGSHF